MCFESALICLLLVCLEESKGGGDMKGKGYAKGFGKGGKGKGGKGGMMGEKGT
jgi:hypothetical protein